MAPKRQRLSDSVLIKKLSSPSRSDKLEANLDFAIDAFSDCVIAANKSVKAFEQTLDPADILPAIEEMRKALKKALLLEAALAKLEASV
jgi:hypothetical protein